MKLLLEVYFYRIVIQGIFWITGYTPFTLKAAAKALLPFTEVAQNFTGCYLIFFLCIPFLNVLVRNMTEKQHVFSLILAGSIYIILGSVPVFDITFNYVTWFCILYLISSYIRLYQKKLFEKTALWGWLTSGMAVLSCASVVVCAAVPHMLGISPSPYVFVSDSNKVLAVCVGVCSFLFFKNLKIKNSAWINAVSATTFGVFCIHTNGDAMRSFLWGDLLRNAEAYHTSWMMVHAVVSVLGVFILCSIIDHIRIKAIEKPLFNRWDKWGGKIEEKVKSIINNILSKILQKT